MGVRGTSEACRLVSKLKTLRKLERNCVQNAQEGLIFFMLTPETFQAQVLMSFQDLVVNAEQPLEGGKCPSPRADGPAPGGGVGVMPAGSAL